MVQSYVPPLSPLYELSPQAAEPQPIRHADYGDREDVLADHEDLRSSSKPFRYPPSAPSSSKPGPSSWTRRRRRFSPIAAPFRRHVRPLKLHLWAPFAVAWPLVWWTIISCLLSDHPALFPSSLRDAKSTLMVVSHPDDECLFFAPAILATVRRARNHGALLVMSAGNHYGLGDTRRKELKASCAELGIRDDRCEVMDISSIQDDPNQWWPTETIIKVVTEHIDKWMIDSIITFDDGGVSGHINHRAVSAAVTQLALSLNSTRSANSPLALPGPAPSLFVVNSVFLLRKYSGLYDLPLTFLGFIPSLFFGTSSQSVPDLATPYDSKTEAHAITSELKRRQATASYERGLLVSGWDGYRSARNAFWKHRSQMVWDRHLYMIVSRYMYFNTIERVI